MLMHEKNMVDPYIRALGGMCSLIVVFPVYLLTTQTTGLRSVNRNVRRYSQTIANFPLSSDSFLKLSFSANIMADHANKHCVFVRTCNKVTECLLV